MAHVIQEERTTSSTSHVTAPLRQGDHERLFRLLEQDGPAPAEFMLGLSDPVLERENLFEGFDEED